MSITNDLHAFSASAFRGLRGIYVTAYNQEYPPRPAAYLEVYEFEACPFCRKVREVLCELDLAYINRTCPRGAKAKRQKVDGLGGKIQFPYLVDSNTDRRLYESEDIIDYLYETYGGGKRGILRGRAFSPGATLLATAASAVRPGGRRVRPGLESRSQPEELLALYGFENSPFCRKVREALNELNLDYLALNVGRRSSRRPELIARGGQMMVPYLVDPNTSEEMYESDGIIAYLDETYGVD